MAAAVNRKARAVGINHVAIEVGDIAAALEFYGRFLDLQVEEHDEDMAIVCFGDQFTNLIRNPDRQPDRMRHFGIAVDDKPPGITTHTDIQFTKADHVLRGMGLGHLTKSEAALSELGAKGMAPG